jgi:hypothetical protein
VEPALSEAEGRNNPYNKKATLMRWLTSTFKGLKDLSRCRFQGFLACPVACKISGLIIFRTYDFRVESKPTP